MRRRVLSLAAAVLLAPPTLAVAAEVEAPDGRAGIAAEPTTSEDAGRLAVEGHAGAFGFDNTLEGDASPDDGGDPYLRLTNPPMYGAHGTRGGEREELYGPAGASAALGTGGLTAGFTEGGVLSNLSWPGPGLYEHVNHLNITRDWPNRGAPENAGSFGGLLFPGEGVSWFTAGDGWEVREQRYEGRDSGVLRTVLRRGSIEVTVRDVVHPTLDVMARDFDVHGAPRDAVLVYYANMNPTTTRTPRVPSTTDGAADNLSDFGTVFDGEGGMMLHFRPARIDPAAATLAATGRPGPDTAAAAVANAFGDGVYVAVGGEAPPVGYQAGLESGGLVRGEAEGSPLLDPFYDARDGGLSRSVAAVGKTAGAQHWDDADGTVFIGAAGTPDAAAAAVAEARRMGFKGVKQSADRDWREWTQRARLPAVHDELSRDVALRALMLIRTAQDRRTGAIVANTTVQTPYRQDWLRDGAFFNYALLVAGYPDMVAAHNAFYRRAQSATGHWDPILCTDGVHCSAVFPFEIDAQGLGVWSQWMEYEFDGDRDALSHRYDSIRAGAEILYACQDPTTGLQCYASEDDAVTPSQGAQGAATVYLGLRSAASAARVLGDTTNAERWDSRAEELQRAAIERLCRPACPVGRGGIYLQWPGKLVGAGDPAADDALRRMANTLDRRRRFVEPAPGGFFQYPMESMFALAWANDPDRQALLEDGIRWLTHEVAAPGVLHYGERIFHFGGGDYLHTVGFPHIWSGTEVYLAAAFVHGVERCRGVTAVGDIACSG